MRAALFAAMAVLLAGCAAPGDPGGETAEDPIALGERKSHLSCTCFEPTVARQGDVIVASELRTSQILVSTDAGRTFEERDPPPIAASPAGDDRNDDLVQLDPAGRLYYTALRVAGVPEAAAIQVARSDDLGRTWATNVNVRVLAPQAPLGAPDRQFLVFGDGDEVTLTWNAPYVGAFVARSTDAGASWSAPVRLGDPTDRIGAPAGGPSRLEDGTIAIPYFAQAEPREGGIFQHAEVRIHLVAPDGSAGERVTVAQLPPASRGIAAFPSSAVDAAGALHVAWTSIDGGAWTATSRDGGATWGAPVRWNAGRPPAELNPWAQTSADGLALAWFENDGGRFDLVVARGDASGARDVALVAQDLADTATDFPAFSLDAQGKGVLAHVDGAAISVVPVEM